MSYRFTGLAGYGTRRSVIDNDAYYLYDTFDDTPLAAGSVNGTQAEPVGGVRTVVDTNSKISVSGGVLSLATGAATNNNVNYPSQARAAGKVLLATATLADTSGILGIGFEAAPQSGAVRNSIRFSATTGIQSEQNGALVLVGAYSAATEYKIALVMRTSGNFLFIKGGSFINWTMLWLHGFDTAAALPEIWIGNTTTTATVDNFNIAKRLYLPPVLQSDGMSAETTDGAGNAEANGAVGNTYDGVGTPSVAAGVRGFSALSGGGLGVSVLACSSSDVNIEASVTRTSGSAGIIARRADASNYIQCLHNGTNVVVSQVVEGSSTTLSTTAVTYSAGATMRFCVDGTAYRAFYNNTAAGTGTVPASTNTNHGIITNNLSGSFDNLVIWARSGYEGLDQL